MHITQLKLAFLILSFLLLPKYMNEGTSYGRFISHQTKGKAWAFDSRKTKNIPPPQEKGDCCVIKEPFRRTFNFRRRVHIAPHYTSGPNTTAIQLDVKKINIQQTWKTACEKIHIFKFIYIMWTWKVASNL
jgi:hypothetical protein